MMTCRACLKADNIEKMRQFDENIIKSFNLLTNLKVQLNDVMPEHICDSCFRMVNLFTDFRENCICANSLLYSTLNIECIKDENSEPYGNLKITSEQLKKKRNEFENLFAEDDTHSEVDNFMYECVLKNEKCGEGKEKNLKQTHNKHLKTNYSCGLCIKNFEDKTSLLSHLNAHKLDNNTCELCVKQFADWHELFSHRLMHLSNKSDKMCHICFKKFQSSPFLEYHYKTVHSKIEYPTLQCLYCSKKYNTPKQLQTHICRSHTEKIYICECCSKSFNKCDYDKHIVEQTRTTDKGKGSGPTSNTKVKKQMFQCKTCGKSYKTREKLGKHIWRMHSKDVYTCDYCSKEYSYKERLKNHIEMHMNLKTYTCDNCDYSTKYSSNLREHKIRRHTTQRVYCKICSRVFCNELKLNAHTCRIKSLVCFTCGKTFTSNKQLNRHMITHESVGRFACERCGARYRSGAGLRAHRGRHEGVRAVACPRCPAAFYTSSVLTKHMRTHTGVKPYVCKICQKAFTGNNNLKVHMKVHGEYLVKKRVKDEEKEK